MEVFITLACIIAAVSAIPRPAVDQVQVVPNYIPREFRRDLIPNEDLRNGAATENLDDPYAPEPILVNYDINPSQTDMDDLVEFIKDAARVLQINPDIFQEGDIPLNEDGFHYEPIQIANLPIDSNDAEKVIVVNNPSEHSSDGEILQADSVQVVDILPEDDATVAENNGDVEVVKNPINEDQNEAIQVASIPIHSDKINPPADDEIRAVKFVDNPQIDGIDNFVGVPIAPSELDSLRVNFGGVEEGTANEDSDQFSFYPLKLYPDPLLR